MMSSENNLEFIKKKLKEVSKKQRRKNLAEGIIFSIASMFLINLLFSSLELLGFNSQLERKIFFYSGMTLIGLIMIYQVIFRLAKYFGLFVRTDYLHLAKSIGDFFPEVKDELINALQLGDKKNELIFSRDLISASISRITNKIQNIRLADFVNYNSTKKYTLIISTFITINIILFLLLPQLSWASFRLINYEKNFSVVSNIMFEISPGDTVITKGDGVRIKINIYGESISVVELMKKKFGDENYSSKKIFRNDNGYFISQLENLQTSFSCFVIANDIRSEKFNIKVIDRPKIKSLRFSITPPSYSGLPSAEQIDNGNINALVGSTISIKLVSSKDLAKANIIFEDSAKIKFNIKGNKADISFRITKNTKYKISVTDKDGISNAAPIEYYINVAIDNYPTIELINPDGDVRLDARKVVPINAQIKDDYGFHKLELKYRLSLSHFEKAWDNYRIISINIPADAKEFMSEYLWNFSEINPAVGDVYSFYLEVFDNDRINGPKASRTNIINVRIPSLDEIYDEVEAKQNEAGSDLNKVLKETEQLKKELEKISSEIKKDQKDLTWNEKEKIQKSVEKLEQLQEKIQDVKEQLNEVQKDLNDNKLLSGETLKKYDEMQKLLSELTSDEMKEALKKLEDALKLMNRDNTQKAMEQMKLNEEMFQKSLERTINLLKRIQIEQKMEEAVKRANEINDQLEQLQKDMNEKSNTDELQQKQNELSKQLDNLGEELKKLSDKMKEFDDMPNKDMQKLQEEYEEQENDELADQMRDETKSGNREKASKTQKQLMQNMKRNKQKLEQLQSSMQMQNQMNTMMQMMKALNGIITISKEQEKIKEKNYSNADVQENSKIQNQLRSNLDKIINQLADLSQKTFAITPEMGKALGKAKANMNKSLQDLQSKNLSSAKNAQQQAMKSLNESAALLKGGMEQMMQSGGQGAGMMSMMQQMEKLSQQQMGLNQLTQKMQGGDLSEGEQGELQKLAQQQEMIRKSMDELNQEAKEAGQSKKLSANLDEIVNEIKEVVNSLKSQKVNDDVIKSQDKILSRMLDAQRSMNERDYEQNRESSTGKIFNRQSPGQLSGTDKKTKLQEELQKALREGYKKDYEDLIRKYFEEMEKK